MKIIFLTRLYSPHVGGVEKVVENISMNLVNNGHNVEVITSRYNFDLAESELIGKVRVIRISYPRIKYLGLFFIWFQMISLIPKFLKADIIHIHDVFIWYLPVRLLIPFKKVYLTIHGWEGGDRIPIKNVLQKKLSCFLSYKTILVGAYLEKIFGIKGDLISYGGVKEEDNLNVRHKKGIVFLGRLDKSTDLPVVINFIKRYKFKHQIRFIGDGSLSSVCRKIGKVTGFTNPVPYLVKSRICIASGYLSALESLIHKNETVVVCSSYVRKLAFRLAPFFKYVYVVEDEEALNKILRKMLKMKSVSKKTLLGAKFAKKLTWEKLTKDYLNLWNEK